MAGNYTLDNKVYMINGNDIALYGAVVEQWSGLLDTPKRKPILQYSWPEENGLDVDLSAGFFVEARTAKIIFLIKGDNFKDLQVKKAALVANLKRPGYQYLKMAGIAALSLVFLSEQIVFEMLSNRRDMPCGGKLTLTLTEPFPETRQFYTEKTEPGNSSLTINTTKPVTIDWGDGHYICIANGEETLTHNYETAGVYDIVVYPADGIISIRGMNCTDIEDVVNDDTIYSLADGDYLEDGMYLN